MNLQMRRLIRQLLVVILFGVLGGIFLGLYGLFNSRVFEIPLYAASTIAITLSLNRLALLIERRLRRTEEIRFSFSRTFYFLIPCIFAFYLFYSFQEFVPRLILGILVLIFTFLFECTLGAAIGNTTLGRRRINSIYGTILMVLICFLASLFTGNTGVLLLLPLSLMLLYTENMRSSFFRDFGREYYSRTVWITGALAIVLIILLILNQVTSDAVSTIYNTTIIVYGVLLTIAGGFTVYVLTQRYREGVHTVIAVPIQGLALFCLAMIGITILGILTGTHLDGNIFTQGTTLSTVFSDLLSVMTLFRVLIIYFVIISFPFTFVYSYAVFRESIQRSRLSN